MNDATESQINFGSAEHRPMVIVGTGPAGLTAAIYTARANLSPVVIEGMQSGGHMLHTTPVTPEPLIKPKRDSERLDLEQPNEPTQ